MTPRGHGPLPRRESTWRDHKYRFSGDSHRTSTTAHTPTLPLGICLLMCALQSALLLWLLPRNFLLHSRLLPAPQG